MNAKEVAHASRKIAHPQSAIGSIDTELPVPLLDNQKIGITDPDEVCFLGILSPQHTAKGSLTSEFATKYERRLRKEAAIHAQKAITAYPQANREVQRRLYRGLIDRRLEELVYDLTPPKERSPLQETRHRVHVRYEGKLRVSQSFCSV